MTIKLKADHYFEIIGRPKEHFEGMTTAIVMHKKSGEQIQIYWNKDGQVINIFPWFELLQIERKEDE